MLSLIDIQCVLTMFARASHCTSGTRVCSSANGSRLRSGWASRGSRVRRRWPREHDMAVATEVMTAALVDLAVDAARCGDVEMLVQTLAAGVPLESTTARGDSLLMLATCHGNLDAVRTLLQAGADPDVRDTRGQTPLAGAAFKG